MIATIACDCFSQLRKFEPKQQKSAVVQSFCYLVTRSLVHVISRLKGKLTFCLNTMSGSRGGGAGGPEHPKNHKNIGFLSNIGPDPL